MGRVVLDRTVAGRRMHGGLVPRNGAKKDAKPPPTKNLLAAWRTWRLRVRSGCRDLTPGGAHRSEAAAIWATRPRNPKPPAPNERLPFPVSRLPFPVLPFSRSPAPQAERRRPKAATHKESPCGVAYLAPSREIRPPRPHSSGAHTRSEAAALWATRPRVPRSAEAAPKSKISNLKSQIPTDPLRWITLPKM